MADQNISHNATKDFEVKGLPWWRLNFKVIGSEKQPLLIIDNFFPTPSFLQEEAEAAQFAKIAPYYPGERAVVQTPYLNILMQGLTDPIVKLFDYSGGAKVEECFYSKLTTAPEALNMVQRLPHIDGGHDDKVAILHYLCGPEFGGTAFYKQNATGFETVSNDRFQAYKDAIYKEHDALGPPDAAYFNESDNRFEKIAEVEAKYNRAIVYFGRNLHAVLPGKTDFKRAKETPLDISKTRLTVNTFISPQSK